MIKTRPIPESTFDRIPALAEYLQSLPIVQFAYLFGSLASGRSGPMSDVDIAVYLEEDAVTAENKLEILGHMIAILETDEVDLVILNQASLPLKMNCIKSRSILAENNPFARHLFESKTMREYLDFSRFETNILRRKYLDGR